MYVDLVMILNLLSDSMLFKVDKYTMFDTLIYLRAELHQCDCNVNIHNYSNCFILRLVFITGFFFLQYIGIRADHNSTHIVHIYSPFWIVNKSKLDLEFEHQVQLKTFIKFTYYDGSYVHYNKVIVNCTSK